MAESSISKATASMQENLLILLCFDRENCKLVSNMISPELFEASHYRTIAKASMDFIAKYGEPPEEHIADLLEDILVQGDRKARLYQDTLGHLMSGKQTVNVEYVINTLTTFIGNQKLKLSITEAVDLIQRGREDEAKAVILEGCKTNNLTIDVGHDFTDDVAFLFSEDEVEGISTGVDALDKMNVLVERKTLLIFLANANRGKSFFLVQLGKMAAIQRQKVLHITLEMSAKKTAQRYLQAFTASTSFGREVKIPTFVYGEDGEVVAVDITEEERLNIKQDGQELRKKHKKVAKRIQLKIKEFPTSQLTVPGFLAYLDVLENQTGFIPDVVIIDYAELMKLDSANLRHSIGDLNKQLRGISVERNFALVTASQANREAETAKVLTLRHLAEAYNKAADADIILSYSQTEKERQKGLARLYVAKARDTGGVGSQIVITQNYASGQFCIDSVLLKQSYWEALNDTEDDDE